MAQEFAGIDLNLLVVLVRVIESGSVKAASRRLGCTPSAVSHSLTRLRAQIGDPLVVRSADGMRPTERAKSLVDASRPALDLLDRALRAAAHFDPRELRRTFTLASAGVGTVMLVPRLLNRLSETAPDVRLRVTALPVDADTALASTVDVMIGILPRPSSPALHRRRIVSERYVAAVRAEHPHAGNRFTLEQYAAARHVVIAPRGRVRGPIDEVLERVGLTRDVALSMEDFLAAPRLVLESDLVLTGGERFLRRVASELGLRIIEIDAALPRFDLALVWHDRAHHDPAHRWLREEVARVADAVYEVDRSPARE